MPLSDGLLSGGTVWLADLVWFDFASDPLWVASAQMPVSVPAGLAGAGLAVGQTFTPINADVARLGPVQTGSGGSATFIAELLADPANPALIDAVNDPSLYAGRAAERWLATIGADGVATGIEQIFAGVMAVPSEQIALDAWGLRMECESYLALLGMGGKLRTYLMQGQYDAGDLSAAATLGIGRNAGPMQINGDVPGYWRGGEAREAW